MDKQLASFLHRRTKRTARYLLNWKIKKDRFRYFEASSAARYLLNWKIKKGHSTAVHAMALKINMVKWFKVVFADLFAYPAGQQNRFSEKRPAPRQKFS